MAHLISQRDGTWLLIFKPGNVNRNYKNCHLIFPLVEMVTFKEIPVHLRLLSNHDKVPAILRVAQCAYNGSDLDGCERERK